MLCGLNLPCILVWPRYAVRDSNGIWCRLPATNEQSRSRQVAIFFLLWLMSSGPTEDFAYHPILGLFCTCYTATTDASRSFVESPPTRCSGYAPHDICYLIGVMNVADDIDLGEIYF